MSLAQLFYARQAHRARTIPQGPSRTHPRRHRPPPRRRKILLEPLEPRLLLAAEPLSFLAMPDVAIDLTLRLVDDAGTLTL